MPWNWRWNRHKSKSTKLPVYVDVVVLYANGEAVIALLLVLNNYQTPRYIGGTDPLCDSDLSHSSVNNEFAFSSELCLQTTLKEQFSNLISQIAQMKLRSLFYHFYQKTTIFHHVNSARINHCLLPYPRSFCLQWMNMSFEVDASADIEILLLYVLDHRESCTAKCIFQCESNALYESTMSHMKI